MHYKVSIFVRGTNPWWINAVQALESVIPEEHLQVFGDPAAFVSAAKVCVDNLVLILSPESSADLDRMLVEKEWLREREILTILPTDSGHMEERVRELHPRIVLCQPVSPSQVVESVLKMGGRISARVVWLENEHVSSKAARPKGEIL